MLGRREALRSHPLSRSSRQGSSGRVTASRVKGRGGRLPYLHPWRKVSILGRDWRCLRVFPPSPEYDSIHPRQSCQNPPNVRCIAFCELCKSGWSRIVRMAIPLCHSATLQTWSMLLTGAASTPATAHLSITRSLHDLTQRPLCLFFHSVVDCLSFAAVCQSWQARSSPPISSAVERILLNTLR